MKVSAVIVNSSKKSRKIPELKPSLILSFLAVFSGFVSGTLLYCFLKESLYNDVFSIFISFFSDYTQKSSPEILSGLIVSELPYIFMMLIFSFSAIGYPFCFIMTFVKSLAPTVLFSHLYCEYGLKGAEYVFLVLIAGEIISLFGVLLMTQSSFTLSRFFADNIKNAKGESTAEIKAFLLKFFVSTAIILLSNIITLLTVSLFSDLFVF